MLETLIKVLLVSNQEADYKLLVEQLSQVRSHHYEIDWCDTFDTAINIAKKISFDVILVDYDLEDTQCRSGIDWSASLNTLKLSTPVILIGNDDALPDLEELAFEAGASDYITKSEMNTRSLVRALRYAIERSTIHRHLLKSESRHRSLVEVQTDLICRFLPDTTLTYVNSAYCDYFGRDKSELIGKPFLSVIPKEEHPAIRQHIANLLASRQAVIYEHEVMTPHNGLRWQRWTDHIVYDEFGRPAELQSIGTDITELKQIQQQLKDALEKERDLNELKSRFIAMTSHEFRTPLASIKATSETLRDFYDQMNNSERSKRFRRIDTQISHMTTMLDEILMIEELSSEDNMLNTEQFDIAKFFAEVVDEFNQMQDAHTIEYKYHIESIMVNADKKLVRQIITNLLSNAVKYSGDDTLIQLILEHTAEMVRFTIKDSGIGINKDDLDHIFEPFHRGINSDSKQGTGLGLSIVKRAVDKHNGSIRIASIVEQGTSITVSLPIFVPCVNQDGYNVENIVD